MATNWFINPFTGLDSNSGSTAASPLRTFRELANNRWGKGKLLPSFDGHVTVYIDGSLLPSDPLNFDVILDNNVNLKFEGLIPPVNPANQITVTSILARKRDVNIPWTFTIPGGIEIGQRIYCQTQQAYMWPFKIEDAINKIYRISEPLAIPSGVGNSTTGFLVPDNKKSLVTADDFYIDTLPDVKTGSMRVGSTRTPLPNNLPTRNRLVFLNLNIIGDIGPELDMGTELNCYGCSIRGSIQLATGFARNFFNCCQLPGHMIRISSGLTRFAGGAYIGDDKLAISQAFLVNNCTTQFDLDVIFQYHSISIVAGNSLIIGTAGIFESVPGGNGKYNMAGNGIMVSAGSVTCRQLLDREHHLWGCGKIGAGNKGNGVAVSAGGRFLITDSPPATDGSLTSYTPTIAGAQPEGVDFVLGENSSINSYAPNDDGTFSGPFPNTWINLKTPIAPPGAPVGTPPGFGGNAAIPKSDAWILKTL